MKIKHLFLLIVIGAIATQTGWADDSTTAPSAQTEAQQPKPSKEGIQEIEALRPATDTEVSAMIAEIHRRISPFTLEEIFKGAGGTRVEERNGQPVTVTGQVIAAGNFSRSDFFVKKGSRGTSLSDTLSGNVGEHAVTFRRVAGKPDVLVFADENDVYSEFQKVADGKWMIRRYKETPR